MQLYDKDLLSMQEVRELVGAAKKAQQELAEKSQEEVDRIVRSIANAGVRNARRLAQMAHEDTGFGVVEDKVIKNVFASRGVYEYIKDMKTIGAPLYEKAIKLLNAAPDPSRYKSDAAEIYSYLGNSYISVGNKTKAKEMFNEYLKLRPNDEAVRKFVGTL